MHKCVYVLPTCGLRLQRALTCNTFPQQQANGSRVNVLYSTPACYLWELNKANLTWYLGVLGSLRGVCMPMGSDSARNVSAAAGR